MEHAEILHRCFRCGYCKLPSNYQNLNCPSYLNYRFETFSPGGRMWLLRAWLDQEIKTTPRLSEIFFSCTACGNCVEQCVFTKFKDDLLNVLIAGSEELVNQGAVPARVSDYFKSLNLYGNPYKLSEAESGRWAEGLGIEPYQGQEYLFYVGCAGSYDEQGQKMTRSVATILKKLGVSFGIIPKETCDGNEVRTMGEKGLFEKLARRNIDQFRELGIQKVITLSPHAYNIMKNWYPGLGGSFQVYHYSQVMVGLAGKIKYPGRKKELLVTFHDPCYLGRHNKDYISARLILNTIPGVRLVEMDRSMADSLCCGGGGGNFFTDILGAGPESPARVRVQEAKATGAEVLSVACPKCAKMLEDALKAEGLEEIRVMDLAEIMLSHLD